MTNYRRLAEWFKRMNFDEVDHSLLNPEKFSDLSYDEDQEPYGWPWAHRWCYFYDPDDTVLTESLRESGFITGMYEDHAVCGIDGGGYSFEDAHWIPLVLEYCKQRNINPDTWIQVYYS